MKPEISVLPVALIFLCVISASNAANYDIVIVLDEYSDQPDPGYLPDGSQCDPGAWGVMASNCDPILVVCLDSEGGSCLPSINLGTWTDTNIIDLSGATVGDWINPKTVSSTGSYGVYQPLYIHLSANDDETVTSYDDMGDLIITIDSSTIPADGVYHQVVVKGKYTRFSANVKVTCSGTDCVHETTTISTTKQSTTLIPVTTIEPTIASTTLSSTVDPSTTSTTTIPVITTRPTTTLTSSVLPTTTRILSTSTMVPTVKTPVPTTTSTTITAMPTTTTTSTVGVTTPVTSSTIPTTQPTSTIQDTTNPTSDGRITDTVTPRNNARCPPSDCGDPIQPSQQCATLFQQVGVNNCVFADTNGVYGYKLVKPYDAMIQCSKGTLLNAPSINVEPSPYPAIFTSETDLLDVLDNQVNYNYYPNIQGKPFPFLVIGASKLQDGIPRWADGTLLNVNLKWLSPLTNPSGQCIVVRIVGQNMKHSDASNYKFDLVDCFTADMSYLGTICQHDIAHGHSCLSGDRPGYNNTCHQMEMSTAKRSAATPLATPSNLRQTLHLRNMAEKCFDNSFGAIGITIGIRTGPVLDNGQQFTNSLLPIDKTFKQCLQWFIDSATCPNEASTTQSCIHEISCNSACYKTIYQY